MRIVFSGGEKGSYRSILTRNNVRRIAVNLTQLHIPKTKELKIKEVCGGADVYLYTSDDDEDVGRYDEFIRAHQDDLTVVVGRPDYDGEWLGDKYYPLWNDDKDLERLAHLMQKHGRVAISDRAVSGRTIPRIKQLQTRWGASLVGITSKVEHIEAIAWDTVIVSSWTSPVRYGETQVWDGHGLRRYPAQNKVSARKKHRSHIMNLGVDFDAVMEDDNDELAKLAIRSWLEWEMHTYGKETPSAYDPLDDTDEEEFEGVETSAIAAIQGETALSPKKDSGGSVPAIAPLQRRHEGEKVLLPVMGIERVVPASSNPDDQRESDAEPVVLLRTSGVSLRQCDSCYLSARCPMMVAGAECAYKLPVEIRTVEQLDAAFRAIMEMQMSRILFGKFAEELEGQGLDPTLSAELDRFVRIANQVKDAKDTRDLLSINIESRGSSGVINRIFGVKDEPATLKRPITMGELDHKIIDAELV